MPERLSPATVAIVATCALLVVAAFGGAYAGGRDRPEEALPALASPTAIRLGNDPIGELRRVSPLPALIVPPPRREPARPDPVLEDPAVSTLEPEVAAPIPDPTPVPTPAPAPAPTPTPTPPAKPPLTFDDSG